MRVFILILLLVGASVIGLSAMQALTNDPRDAVLAGDGRADWATAGVDAYPGFINWPSGLPAVLYVCIMAASFGMAGGASRGLVIAERKTVHEFNTPKMVIVALAGCVGGLAGFAIMFLSADFIVRMDGGGIPRPMHVACVSYIFGLLSGRILGFLGRP